MRKGQSPSSNGRELVYEAHPLTKVGPISKLVPLSEAKKMRRRVIQVVLQVIQVIQSFFFSIFFYFFYLFLETSCDESSHSFKTSLPGVHVGNGLVDGPRGGDPRCLRQAEASAKLFFVSL